MEDNRIVELYWQRSPEAVRESDRKYGAYCFAIAENILHNREDSEECVNDTWLNAWNAMPPRRPAKLQFAQGRMISAPAVGVVKCTPIRHVINLTL